MSNYYIKAILLKNCSYSLNAYNLLKEYKIKSDIYFINIEEKHIYKTNLINTFPQLYLKKYNSHGHLLLGGYTDFNELLKLIKTKDTENIIEYIENKKWTPKIIKILIKLITKK
jgi:hypothetical protein